MISLLRDLFLAVFFLGAALHAAAEVGRDVAAVFQRAKKGAPLCYVALGGSITQSGKGWIGDWLKEEFPESHVTVFNSGMSATGSALGVFRVGRDVINYQPDLVAIEYCVNDGGLSDEDAVRNMESLIVRLKSLPYPPAILILEAAAEGGVNLSRHRKVAEHYGLLEIDFQKAVDEELEESESEWSRFFGDAVHPNREGNQFYREVMVEALTPYLNSVPEGISRSLPKPLSVKPLILDGRIVPLTGLSNEEGWSGESSLPFWWDKFFNGVLSAEEPGTVLKIPFRGTRVGIYAAMDKSYGSFYASVDGGVPDHVFTNTRGGYLYRIFAKDLEPQDHELTIVLPQESDPETRMNGPVKLGYLLLAGERGATREKAAMGPISSDVMAGLSFEQVPLNGWSWSGPYRLETEASDALPFLDVLFLPERDPNGVEWTLMGETENEKLNLAELTGEEEPSVVYLQGSLQSESGGSVLLGIQVDYYAKMWVNGELVAGIDGMHGNPNGYVYVLVFLDPGENEVFVKVAAGSKGHKFALALSEIGPTVEASGFMPDFNEAEEELSWCSENTEVTVSYREVDQ